MHAAHTTILSLEGGGYDLLGQWRILDVQGAHDILQLHFLRLQGHLEACLEAHRMPAAGTIIYRASKAYCEDYWEVV
jgi:hypothetical protein